MPLDQVDVDKMEKEKEGEQSEMSFLDHLEALRWHLIRSVVAITLVGIVIFIFGKFVFNNIILAPTQKDFFTYRLVCSISETLCFFPKDIVGGKLQAVNYLEQFLTSLKVSFIGGFIVAFPYVFWEIWRFVKPGLYDKERKAARGIVFICSTLFLGGVLFGYFIVAPFAISFLSNYSVSDIVVTQPRLDTVVGLVTMLTLPIGLLFELPIVVYFLTKIGLVTPEFMKQYRRHAFVLILILSAIITPPDVISQFLIGVPLYGLYEASILVSRRVIKNQTEIEPA